MWVQSLGGEDPLGKGMATTPVLLPGKFHGWRSLIGYSPWDCKESDTTEQFHWHWRKGASQGTLVVKNLLANAGDIRDVGSVPGSGRSPGEGHDNSLQYACLENSMDRGAW